MDVGKLYRLQRGNQTATVGLIIKGAAASIQIFGSARKPASVSDMVDCTDSEILNEGSWGFSMLPEYITLTGVADSIDIVGMSFTDLGAIS
jgi:hypothetical protein